MNKTLKTILILTSALFLASCQDNYYNPYSLDYKMTLLEVPKGIIINVDDALFLKSYIGYYYINENAYIVDENDSQIDYSSLNAGDECIAKVYCPSQDLTPSSFMKDIVEGYIFPDDAKFEYYDVFYIQLLGENSAN